MEPKKIGRPRKLAPGPRPTVTFRIPAAVQRAIADAAGKAGRSISEECETRLIASFRDEDMRSILREELERVMPPMVVFNDVDLSDLDLDRLSPGAITFLDHEVH